MEGASFVVAYVLGVRSALYAKGLGDIHDARQTFTAAAVSTAAAAAAEVDKRTVYLMRLGQN